MIKVLTDLFKAFQKIPGCKKEFAAEEELFRETSPCCIVIDYAETCRSLGIFC
jgi:hypothetical protein